MFRFMRQGLEHRRITRKFCHKDLLNAINLARVAKISLCSRARGNFSQILLTIEIRVWNRFRLLVAYLEMAVGVPAGFKWILLAIGDQNGSGFKRILRRHDRVAQTTGRRSVSQNSGCGPFFR